MFSILLQREDRRYYRIELADNIFGEYTLLREWGVARPGTAPRPRVMWFANLREACLAADRTLARVQRRGYRPRTEV